ncbi:bifunctional nicotinamidase/pyrazinamidase [Pontibacter sp. HSC-14F20]|uniref:bifunctional nicotinamidase/pyrazinamidase n=1 Tax=Pontibacter sp. HSC-14F20 TaxID=2864136 RepID=UPI001C72A547|nr:bifunctional nicotinamidase/pyrazinamidase [Pontibacter sp. HSC-14F20]MBX0334469.1 bifunctional nicotinamidase/pyrazinamidase [Pontibacter sp. HSC-14F20]
MKVLLLVDIQNDFMPGGALAVPEGDLIIPVVNSLQSQFDLVMATQDWHPASHKSFASNHEGKNPFEMTELLGLPQVLWPDHCLQGTSGADLAPALEANKIEAIFRKGTNPDIDSYSGFYDNGRLKSTGLADYLRGKGVMQLYLAGLAADYCVYYSAIDALQEGFETFVIENAIRAISQESYAAARNDIQEKGGKIIQSSDLLAN